MTWKPCVLVVAPTPRVATTLFAWLSDAGCAPFVVSSFAAAKQHLEDGPDLLISEVRLGEYNGLHLALRAQAPCVPVVLMGEPDPVLQREALQLGAVYLPYTMDAQQLLAVVQPMLETAVAVRRRPGLGSGESTPARTNVTRGDVRSVSFVSVTPRTRPFRPHAPARS